MKKEKSVPPEESWADRVNKVIEARVQNGDFDKDFKAIIESAKRVVDRRHRETSAVLGFDTKALERKLFRRKSR